MPWLKKLVYVLLIAEISYLVLFNLALQLPVTQTLINQIKPEKFHIAWESAWTWYPFRFHIRGGSANGQARSQQWEFEAGSVSASIDVVPLIFKRVWIDDVQVSDARYYQRPRLKPDKDYSGLVEFFPPISGREINNAITTPKKKKRAWHVDIEGIKLNGQYEYWIMQFKGQAKGSLQADLSVVSRGGLFSLTIPQVDLELGTHYINGRQELFQYGQISGELGIAPMVPRENKGIKMLQYILLDADINIAVDSLAFINLFTRGFNEMKVDGTGLVDGRLHMDQGRVLEGTDLSIDADNIRVNLLSHYIEGDGAIDIEVSPETGDLLDLRVSYNDLLVRHDQETEPMLTGQGLDLKLQAEGDLFRADGNLDTAKSLSLAIDGLSVPDLSLFQRYLPKKWPLQLFGGNGELQGSVSLSSDAANIDLRVSSEAAEIGTGQYRFTSNLDAALKLDNPSLRKGPTYFSGSYIKLAGASLVREGETGSKPWHANFMIEKGYYSVFDRQDKAEKEGLTDLFKLLGEKDVHQMLGDSNGSLEIRSSVSSLAWIGVLLNENYNLSTSGSGTINGIVNIVEGMPAEGTDIKIESKSLVMNFLDYVASGEGKVVFRVEEGGEAPDWLVQVDLSDAKLKRQHESTAHIQQVNLMLRAHIEDMSFADNKRQFELELKIPSAHVDDMSTFNHYLPPDSPFLLTEGTADLSVDILLKPDDADGYIRLRADGMKAVIDDQSISADFSSDITLVDGVPAEMNFDISGSELRLDNVQVSGENESFNEKNWAVVLTLTEADTTWSKPLVLKAKAILSMTDSRPIVAMLGNQKDRPKWVTNMMLVEDIEGRIELEAANDQIVIPYAFIDSDNIDFGAKGVIDETLHNGVIYARYKKLDLLVKISDGKKNIDLFRAKEKFDEYRPPK